MRELVTLQCTICKSRNYTASRDKKKQSERLTFEKFCRFCRKHSPHKETK